MWERKRSQDQTPGGGRELSDGSEARGDMEGDPGPTSLKNECTLSV